MIRDIKLTSGAASQQKSPFLIIVVYQNDHMSSAAKDLNTVSQGYLSNVLQRGMLPEKIGSNFLLIDIPNLKETSVLLVRAGREKDMGRREFRSVIEQSFEFVVSSDIREVCVFFSEINVKSKDLHWKLRQIVDCSYDKSYVFLEYKTESVRASKLKKIFLDIGQPGLIKDAQKAVDEAMAISFGKNICKSLANMPGNICTPEYFANEVIKLSKPYQSISVEILEEAELESLGMGAYLAVSKGSDNSGRFVVIEYQGNDQGTAPVVLIGKGITFDSGGISLKPKESMDIMKFDMAGAAAVCGSAFTVAELKLDINLVVLIPLAENMPGGGATRPGDIVTTLSGKTVEILNTDAEGRLILCDALTYAERFNPMAVIDVATLTGATLIALGTDISGLYSNSDRLSASLQQASEYVLDQAWKLPLHRKYDSYIESKFADMTNYGGKTAASIIAACFLARFSEAFPWAHLDIAGPAFNGSKKPEATGRPVALLTQYLIDLTNA